MKTIKQQAEDKSQLNKQVIITPNNRTGKNIIFPPQSNDTLPNFKDGQVIHNITNTTNKHILVSIS